MMSEKTKYKLRREPLIVSKEEFQRVFRLDNHCHPVNYIENYFEYNKDGTITDHATGLMWQQSGSDDSMNYRAATTYIDRLNRDKFAGCDDWRLPTIEELMSLLESKKQANNLYINFVFEKKQRWCWSADKRSSHSAWYVPFYARNLPCSLSSVPWNLTRRRSYVKAVRSIDTLCLEFFTAEIPANVGPIHLELFERQGQLIEMSATMSGVGCSTKTQAEGIARLVSKSLQHGAELEKIIDLLMELSHESPNQIKRKYPSTPYAIGIFLKERYMK